MAVSKIPGPSRIFTRAACLRTVLFLAISCILTATAFLWSRGPRDVGSIAITHDQAQQPIHSPTPQKAHPIDTLMKNADKEWHRLMAKETTDVEGAARAYRERRGRHPPPGFDKWVEFAQANDAVMVEDFFDQIYHDLNPFWGIEAQKLRQQAKTFDFVVSVRDGVATFKSDEKERPWMFLWHNLTSTIAEYLPDVDMPINIMDESRVVVPWEDINEYVKAEQLARRIVPGPEVITSFSDLKELDADPGEPFDAQFHSGNYWDITRAGCAPDSPSRNVPAATNFSGPPPMPSGFPDRSYEGYVQNWTEAKDPCLNPDLRESHGTFVEPISQSTTNFLIPLFGGSKLPLNNEILIPPAMYWTTDEFYSGGEEHGSEWSKKKTGVIWRGAASGGRNKVENWTRFQRHRFLSMLNGTSVQRAEKNPDGAGIGPNFVLQSYKTYSLSSTSHTDLGTWLNAISDAAFVNLVCFPDKGDIHCPYTDPYYTVKHTLPMREQYAYKFLPDLDGNSFSGRYRGFLRSTSLPIKATIYSEWHDSRLVPWLHFVPMDNSFVDVYGILDYFIGSGDAGKPKEVKRSITSEEKYGKGEEIVEDSTGHDAQAEKIATQGKEWAERVLRREDMQIYVLRLLLEYARICDDRRERLGFVGDM